MGNLKELLARHGMSQTELARLLGRDKSVVTLLLQGKRQLKAEEALLIAQALSVPVAEVIGNAKNDAPSQVNEGMLIPFQHEPLATKKAKDVIAKGGKYYLQESGHFSAKAYALEVRDDSMNLAGVLEGDIIVAELDKPCKAGQLVVVQHYGRGGAKTLIRRYQPPFLMAHSTNAAFGPLHEEEDDVRIVSPVLKLVRLL